MATPNKADYEEVPEVEERVIPLSTEDPRAIYPECDDQQARLLVDIDTVIQAPNPEVKLPRIQASFVNEKAPTTWKELLEALILPTQTFLAAVVAAFATIIWGTTWTQEQVFPYVVCVLEYAATVPSLYRRFTKQSNVAFDTLQELQEEVGTMDEQLDEVTRKCNDVVDAIQKEVKQVVDPVRPKLYKAQKAAPLLEKQDDSIDVPDPDEIEHELDGCHDQVQDSINTAKAAIDVNRSLPIYFKSRKNYTLYIIVPVLVVFFALQLYGVYASRQVLLRDESVNVDDSSGATRRFLRGPVEQELDQVVEQVKSTTTGEASDDDTVSWYPIWIALQVYLLAVAEIVIGFLLTQAYLIAKSINQTIWNVENEANDAIESSGAAAVIDEYLTTKMAALREKLLNLVANMIKIDTIQRNLIEESSEKEDRVDTLSEESQNDEKEHGFHIRLPWSPFGKQK